MPAHRPLLPVMLLFGLALAVASVAGCASPGQSPRAVVTDAFTDLRREINARVDDPSRQAELLSLTDEFETLLDEAVASRRETEARILALNARFDSTEAEFMAALAKTRESTRARQERLLAIQSRAKGTLTASEWNSLGKFRTIALEAAAELTSHLDLEDADAHGQKKVDR